MNKSSNKRDAMAQMLLGRMDGSTNLVSCLLSVFIWIAESNGWVHGSCALFGERIDLDFRIKWMGARFLYLVW